MKRACATLPALAAIGCNANQSNIGTIADTDAVKTSSAAIAIGFDVCRNVYPRISQDKRD